MSDIEAIRARTEPVVWPEAAGIDFPPFDEGRPCIAGTKFLVRNMQLYDGSRLSRPDLVLKIKDEWPTLRKPEIVAALDYHERHRALFERDERRHYASADDVRADVAALLAEVDRRDRAACDLLAVVRAVAAWEEGTGRGGGGAVIDIERRCHSCYRRRACRPSPRGRPTCADCWPTLRCTDKLGYLRCADCQGRSDARIDHEGGVWEYGDDSRCDDCGATAKVRGR